jgi:hypothetical protein
VLYRLVIALSLLALAALKLFQSQDVTHEWQLWVHLATIVELSACLLLVTNYWKLGAWVVMGLGLGSLGFMVWVKFTAGSIIECGCFGALRVGTALHVAIALALLVSGWLLLSGGGTKQPDRLTSS